MKNKNTDTEADFFSDDPEENLRIENEILHLKIKAEFGGALKGTQPLPPNLENQFLKNILKYEHAFANTRQIKIFDFLGMPLVKKSRELSDWQVELALVDILVLLEKKNIVLDFSDEYNARLKYKFITEELFEYETDDVEIPGMTTHYIYEDFHPNHRSDIESRVTEFIQGWFNQQINEDNWELAHSFVLPDETILSKKEVLYKINLLFDSYSQFCASSYTIDKIQFEIKKDDETGVGYAEGFVTYQAVMENGKRINVEGAIKICLSMEYKWWNIFYFVVPGFSWK